MILWCYKTTLYNKTTVKWLSFYCERETRLAPTLRVCIRVSLFTPLHPLKGGMGSLVESLLHKKKMTTFWLSSLHLRAENETRTRDPNLGKVVLYQLSYFRKMCCITRSGDLRVQR